MGWELAGRRRGPSSRVPAVTAKLYRAGGVTKGRVLQIMLRAEIEALCPFLAGNVRACTLRIGTGALAGKIRIEPGESYRISRHAGRLGMPLVLNLEPPVMGVFAATRCEFCASEGWIEIELPDWARPRAELARAPMAVCFGASV